MNAFGAALLSGGLAASAAFGQQAPEPHRGRHGNPADLEGYIAAMEDPARSAWQKPDEVVRALGLRSGAAACDIGAGPGYFAVRLAAAVAPAGHVWAVDVEPRMVETLRERLAAAKRGNITPVLSLPEDPLLPDALCDVILIVNTYHHFPDPPAYLRRLARSLRRGGRVVNIDFQKRDTPHGPPVEHRISREDFLAQARGAGLELAGEETFLPYQYFVFLKPAATAP